MEIVVQTLSDVEQVRALSCYFSGPHPSHSGEIDKVSITYYDCPKPHSCIRSLGSPCHVKTIAEKLF